MGAKPHPLCIMNAEERITSITKGDKERPCLGNDIRLTIMG